MASTRVEDALVLAAKLILYTLSALIVFFAGYGVGAWFNWF